MIKLTRCGRTKLYTGSLATETLNNVLFIKRSVSVQDRFVNSQHGIMCRAAHLLNVFQFNSVLLYVFSVFMSIFLFYILQKLNRYMYYTHPIVYYEQSISLPQNLLEANLLECQRQVFHITIVRSYTKGKIANKKLHASFPLYPNVLQCMAIILSFKVTEICHFLSSTTKLLLHFWYSELLLVSQSCIEYCRI